jgi:ATP-dependent exoDNAse (exonuclease V) beta subunit
LQETKHQGIYEKEMEMSILDQVNLFYVANTRPTEKLFLLVDKALPSKISKSKSFQFSKLMHDFISINEVPEIDTDIYRMGVENSIQKHPQEKTENNTNKTENIILAEIKENENWREHIQLALDTDKSWNESAAWGQKVHSVLAEINHKKDIETVFTGLIYRGVIDQEEQNILEGLVLQVIEHQKLKQFYTEDVMVYNERDMINSQGELKRPDRMVISKDTIFIIDYKTGHPKEKDKEQVMEYMQMAGQFLKKNTKGYLVYLHEDIMIEEL